MVLKTNLKDYRQGKNITQAELAVVLGTCEKCIGRLERCEYKRPQYELLYNIAQYFQVPVQTLFWYEDK